MILTIHAGHNPDGMAACGAVGLIRESTEARRVKDRAAAALRAAGHTVYDVTVEDGRDQREILDRLVERCDSYGDAQLHVSIHFNAGGKGDLSGDGATKGVEALVYRRSGPAVPYARAILAQIAALGYRNRGVKERPDLAVLRRTKAPALLVECCFVDDADDVRLYDADRMANAVVSGIGKAAEASAREEAGTNAAGISSAGETVCTATENHDLSNEEFIGYIGMIARADWERTRRMLPSAVVAQAIQESTAAGRFGQSELGRRANNLFGLKAQEGVWTGRVYNKVTKEFYDGVGAFVPAAFRAYDSWYESVLDHNNYIATRKLGGSGKLLYGPVVGNGNYRSVCTLLKTCGYATGPDYDRHLMRQIERYGLERLDEEMDASEWEEWGVWGSALGW